MPMAVLNRDIVDVGIEPLSEVVQPRNFISSTASFYNYFAL